MMPEDAQRHLEEGGQILKSRDDPAPVFFERNGGAEETAKPFRLSDSARCSWANEEETFGPEKLRPRIEPWLTALVQSEHLSLLLGSGLTIAAHAIATEDALPGMGTITFELFNEEISAEANRAANSPGAIPGTSRTRSVQPMSCSAALRSSLPRRRTMLPSTNGSSSYEKT